MLRSVFIAPGTRWCGNENDAESYTHLGASYQTDKCCRRHDHCKINISALSKKWNLRNSRPFTISHCNCDLRFVNNFFFYYFWFIGSFSQNGIFARGLRWVLYRCFARYRPSLGFSIWQWSWINFNSYSSFKNVSQNMILKPKK